MFNAILTPISTVFGFGLNVSGVKAIAERNKIGNQEEISNVFYSIRIVIFISGIIALICIYFASDSLSLLSFGSKDFSKKIAILGLAVFFGNFLLAENCLLQGKRKLLELAKANIWGALGGTFLSIPFIIFLNQEGIVFCIVFSTMISFFSAWWFSREEKKGLCSFRVKCVYKEIWQIISFGIPVMLTTLINALSAYLTRRIIMNHFDLDGVGLWSAAYSISAIMVNFVLSSMGTDYYPRLTSIAHDNSLVKEELNTQGTTALLLAIPALVVTFLFAPTGINLLFSSKFSDAIPLLRWSVWGILGKVASWPLGYIIIAQGRGKLFFMVELISNLVNLVLVSICCKYWGLTGAGIGFMIFYIFHLLFMIVVIYLTTKISYNMFNFKLLAFCVILLLFCNFLTDYFQSSSSFYIFSIILSFFAVFYSFRRLSELSDYRPSFMKILNKLK